MDPGITLSANGTLDTSTISVSMNKGTSSSLNPTPVEITTDFSSDKKSVTAKTTSLAQYAQPYFVIIDGKDTAGNSVHLKFDFKTANISCSSPLVSNDAGTACVNPPIICTSPQVLNSAGTACVNPPIICTSPQVLNSAGTACVNPPLTCTAPKVVSSDGTACVDAVLHYSEKVYALWTAGYIFSVSKSGVTKLPNNTQYQTGYYQLGNCGMMDATFLSQTNGKILVNCQDAVTTNRHVLYIDPTRNDGLYEYTGTIPANIIWNYVIPADWYQPYPNWGDYAKVSDGYFFVYGYASWVLNFQDNNGVVSTIKAGTFDNDGTIRWLTVYSN